MLTSKVVQTQFVVAILCSSASYSDLLLEARNQQVVILEMIPFSKEFNGYMKHIAAGTGILFVMSPGKSQLVQNEENLSQALESCCYNSNLVTTP